MTTAASVSGLGQGSAIKAGQKGRKEEFVGFERLVGPKIVYANYVTLVGGTMVVTLPFVLEGATTDYVVITNTTVATACYGTVTTTSKITLTGAGTETVNFIVVKTSGGLAAGGL